MRSSVIAAAMLLLATSAFAQQKVIGSDRAREIALRLVPQNQGVKSEKLKTHRGVLIYEMDVETPGPGHREIRLDAHTGVVISDRHEDDLAGRAGGKIDKVFSDDEVAGAQVNVSQARARQIALSRFPNGSIKDIDLETENGIVVWEVHVDTPGKGHHELLIDAQTGTVLQQNYKK